MGNNLVINVKPPIWLEPIYNTNNNYNFICVYGGRASGKTYNIADYLIVQSFFMRDCYILCAREIQKSLLASTYSVIDIQIKALGLEKYFKFSRDGIVNTLTNVKFIFKGLWSDPDSIKGIPNIQIIYIDEAANISKNSWNILPPTLTRNLGSKLICTFNPQFASDVVYKEFVEHNNRSNAYVVKISYKDNPYALPQEFYNEMNALKERDYDEYLHVYEGHCVLNSNTRVFKKDVYWTVKDFEEHQGVELRFGLDLGFSPTHPTFAVRMYVHDKQLWVTHEAVETGLDIDKINNFLVNKLPQIKNHTIWVDSSRPETISAINKQYVEELQCYLFAQGVEKGAGSVEDGIENMKSYKMINIHPRCVNLIENFNLYSYKVDRRGNILRDIEKKYDDGIDAIRYGLESLVKNREIDYSKWNYNNLRF